MFSSTVGVAMQRVVPCLNWCASTGNPNLPPQTDGPLGQVEYWNAGCGESRMSGVDAGKERKLLPMHTERSVLLKYKRGKVLKAVKYGED